MSDITITDAHGAVKETLNSEDRTTVGDLLEMIGAGVLRKDGVLKASKSYVLEPGTCTWHPRDDDEHAKKRRMDDLLAYHKATIETGTPKSSKLLKVRRTSSGSKLCFLCATAGSAENKINASHIVQKQDICATGGDDAIHTFDILKGWASGHGWIRPFQMHDPMNLIWLCHEHNLAFDSHHFGLCLTGLDNAVGFCSYSHEHDALVNSANSRLMDANEPYFDMNYVSRRAVGMRLFKAQEAGHFLNYADTSAWETVVRLSAAASVDHNTTQHDED